MFLIAFLIFVAGFIFVGFAARFETRSLNAFISEDINKQKEIAMFLQNYRNAKSDEERVDVIGSQWKYWKYRQKKIYLGGFGIFLFVVAITLGVLSIFVF